MNVQHVSNNSPTSPNAQAYGQNRLPSAHTCFNQLDLPEYECKEQLVSKLMVALKQGAEGFGFA
jgi:E3 ubiquitin-protein ligase HUWE1